MNESERYVKLNEAFQYVSDKFLDIVEQESRKKKRQPAWVIYSAVAACICMLIVLPVSAMGNNWFGIRDLFVPDPINKYNIISLSGYQGSPEAEALREWNEFLENYDTDHKILNELGTDEPIEGSREDWSFYGIYTQEMEEKLDEIAEKYGLKLHTEMNVIDQDELMRRVGGCFMDKESLTWAYMYEDGYFHVEGDAVLSGSETADFQMIRCVKGTFNDVVLSVENVEEFTEWEYLTDCGETMLLALSPSQALIFADFEECFVFVNVLCGSESGMTAESLQELADMIDFSILKDVQVPEMSGDSVVDPENTSLLEVLEGEIGNLGTGTLAITVPGDDKQDYRLYFFADGNEELKAENADYVFPDAREGNIPIGTFQTFEVLQIGDIKEKGDAAILLVGDYGVGEELHYDARVYTWGEEGYVLDAEFTQELNEKNYERKCIEETFSWEIPE